MVKLSFKGWVRICKVKGDYVRVGGGDWKDSILFKVE